MATSSKLYEEYGFKAEKKGIFQEWREKTSSLIEKNPKWMLVMLHVNLINK